MKSFFILYCIYYTVIFSVIVTRDVSILSNNDSNNNINSIVEGFSLISILPTIRSIQTTQTNVYTSTTKYQYNTNNNNHINNQLFKETTTTAHQQGIQRQQTRRRYPPMSSLCMINIDSTTQMERIVPSSSLSIISKQSTTYIIQWKQRNKVRRNNKLHILYAAADDENFLLETIGSIVTSVSAGYGIVQLLESQILQNSKQQQIQAQVQQPNSGKNQQPNQQQRPQQEQLQQQEEIQPPPPPRLPKDDTVQQQIEIMDGNEKLSTTYSTTSTTTDSSNVQSETTTLSTAVVQSTTTSSIPPTNNTNSKVAVSTSTDKLNSEYNNDNNNNDNNNKRVIDYQTLTLKLRQRLQMYNTDASNQNTFLEQQQEQKLQEQHVPFWMISNTKVADSSSSSSSTGTSSAIKSSEQYKQQLIDSVRQRVQQKEKQLQQRSIVQIPPATAAVTATSTTIADRYQSSLQGSDTITSSTAFATASSSTSSNEVQQLYQKEQSIQKEQDSMSITRTTINRHGAGLYSYLDFVDEISSSLSSTTIRSKPIKDAYIMTSPTIKHISSSSGSYLDSLPYVKYTSIPSTSTSTSSLLPSSALPIQSTTISTVEEIFSKSTIVDSAIKDHDANSTIDESQKLDVTTLNAPIDTANVLGDVSPSKHTATLQEQQEYQSKFEFVPSISPIVVSSTGTRTSPAPATINVVNTFTYLDAITSYDRPIRKPRSYAPTKRSIKFKSAKLPGYLMDLKTTMGIPTSYPLLIPTKVNTRTLDEQPTVTATTTESTVQQQLSNKKGSYSPYRKSFKDAYYGMSQTKTTYLNNIEDGMIDMIQNEIKNHLKTSYLPSKRSYKIVNNNNGISKSGYLNTISDRHITVVKVEEEEEEEEELNDEKSVIESPIDSNRLSSTIPELEIVQTQKDQSLKSFLPYKRSYQNVPKSSTRSSSYLDTVSETVLESYSYTSSTTPQIPNPSYLPNKRSYKIVNNGGMNNSGYLNTILQHQQPDTDPEVVTVQSTIGNEPKNTPSIKQSYLPSKKSYKIVQSVGFNGGGYFNNMSSRTSPVDDSIIQGETSNIGPPSEIPQSQSQSTIKSSYLPSKRSYKNVSSNGMNNVGYLNTVNAMSSTTGSGFDDTFADNQKDEMTTATSVSFSPYNRSYRETPTAGMMGDGYLNGVSKSGST